VCRVNGNFVPDSVVATSSTNVASIGEIAGGVIGGVLCIALCVIALICFKKRRETSDPKDSHEQAIVASSNAATRSYGSVPRNMELPIAPPSPFDSSRPPTVFDVSEREYTGLRLAQPSPFISSLPTGEGLAPWHDEVGPLAVPMRTLSIPSQNIDYRSIPTVSAHYVSTRSMGTGNDDMGGLLRRGAIAAHYVSPAASTGSPSTGDQPHHGVYGGARFHQRPGTSQNEGIAAPPYMPLATSPSRSPFVPR